MCNPAAMTARSRPTPPTQAASCALPSVERRAPGRKALAPRLFAVAIAALALLPGRSSAQGFSLGVRRDFAASGPNSRWVTVGDLNGDGKADLVVANEGGTTVSVLLGDGTGGFSPKTDFTTGSQPNMAAIADLNGDGKPDLAVANYGAGTLSVLLGNGAGGFGPKTDYTVGAAPQAVVIGDMNVDGRPDIVVANGNSNSVSVLLGNGAGGFPTRTDYTTGTNPIDLRIADLNNDGRLDVATANFYGTSASVLLGTGGGALAARVDYAANVNPGSVALGDLDGDGKLDLVVANSGPGNVSVRLGDGLGGFGAKLDYPAGAAAFAVVIDDVDGDGLPDLVTGNGTGNTVSVLLGLPAPNRGTFGAKTDFSVGSGPYCVADADINGDGRRDLLTSNFYGNSVSVLIAGGSAGFLAKSDYPSGSLDKNVVIRDLNGDGRLDLAVADNGERTVSVWSGAGDGTFGPRATVPTADFPSFVAVGDVNVDGIPDLVASNFSLGTVSIMLGQGAGSFGAHYEYATNLNPNCVALADLNGDGKPEILTADKGSNFMSVLYNNGAGTFGTHVSYTTGLFPVHLAVGDVNKDGLADVVIANANSATLTVYLGFSGGGLILEPNVLTGATPVWVAIGDLNGDGNPDLACANQGGNSVSVMLGNGNGTFGARSDYPTNLAPSSVAIGDLNGDGVPDLAVAHWSATPVSVLLGSGNGGFGPKADFPAGSYPSSASIADLNGDGRPDLAVTNYYTNAVSILLAQERTRTTLTPGPNPAVLGGPMTLAANVSVAASGVWAATGSVSFFDGSTLLGSSPVNGGAAGLALFAPWVGSRSLTAVYSGDAKHSGSIAPAQVARVVPTAAPTLAGIKDIGGDQGHQLRVRFRSSGFDFLGSGTPIQGYDVYRRIAAGLAPGASNSPALEAAGFAPRPGERPAGVLVDGWDLVGTLSARADSAYNIVVPTLADSNAAGIHRTIFFVSAKTSAPGVFYDSAADSGYSVDNLPPAIPAPFLGAFAAGSTHLHWGANSEPDLWYYRVYRGASADFIPDAASLIATRPDTGYTDPGPAGRFYKLSAVDANGNESGFALSTPGTTLGVGEGEPLAFALTGVRPNPATGSRLSVSFALPNAEPARLELLDLGGRRVASRDVGTLGGGRHVAELAAGSRLSPGLYLVRLTQGAHRLVTRVTVLQ